MSISILYFAGAKDAVGTSQEDLPWEHQELSIERLAALLCVRHPGLHLEGVRFALNEEFVDASELVRDGDVVAVIPPVSGG